MQIDFAALFGCWPAGMLCGLMGAIFAWGLYQAARAAFAASLRRSQGTGIGA